MPSITAILAISLIWGYLGNTQFGLLNYMLSEVGIGPVEWLSDPKFAKLSLAVVGIWRATGLNIIIFLAALQADSSRTCMKHSLDGATTFQQTQIHHRAPQPAILDLLRLRHDARSRWLQFFDEPFVLTRGRPLGDTTSVSIFIYNEGFRLNQFGFAELRLRRTVRASSPSSP